MDVNLSHSRVKDTSSCQKNKWKELKRLKPCIELQVLWSGLPKGSVVYSQEAVQKKQEGKEVILEVPRGWRPRKLYTLSSPAARRKCYIFQVTPLSNSFVSSCKSLNLLADVCAIYGRLEKPSNLRVCSVDVRHLRSCVTWERCGTIRPNCMTCRKCMSVATLPEMCM
jgi:hypothetical protein